MLSPRLSVSLSAVSLYSQLYRCHGGQCRWTQKPHKATQRYAIHDAQAATRGWDCRNRVPTSSSDWEIVVVRFRFVRQRSSTCSWHQGLLWSPVAAATNSCSRAASHRSIRSAFLPFLHELLALSGLVSGRRRSSTSLSMGSWGELSSRAAATARRRSRKASS